MEDIQKVLRESWDKGVKEFVDYYELTDDVSKRTMFYENTLTKYQNRLNDDRDYYENEGELCLLDWDTIVDSVECMRCEYMIDKLSNYSIDKRKLIISKL